MTPVLEFLSSSAIKHKKKVAADSIRMSMFSVCIQASHVAQLWTGDVTVSELGWQKPPSDGPCSSGKWWCHDVVGMVEKKHVQTNPNYGFIPIKMRMLRGWGKKSQLLIACLCLCSYVILPVCIVFCSGLIIISSCVASQCRNTTVSIRN